MRAVVQRVSRVAVTVDGAVVGEIGLGFLVLVGVTAADTPTHAALLAAKIAKLRVFQDGDGKMNLSLQDVGGKALAVSQFTLYADIARGNRPSFIQAAPPEQGNALYDLFCEELRKNGVPVEKGVFGASMRVELVNEGPVTICMDTDIWPAPKG